MAKIINSNIRIAGITAAIPENQTTIYELGKPFFSQEEMDLMKKTVGVENMYVCREDQSSGDLGLAAAEKLIEQVEWDKGTIDAIIFVSQSLDYIIPPTSAALQYRLGLKKDIFTLDANYGCSGFVSGLLILSQLIQTGLCRRAILINSECHRRFISKEDRNGTFLFGDGAAATAVEFTASAGNAAFLSMLDGSHSEDISLGLYKKTLHKNPYGEQFSYMDGEAVTGFMLRNIPKLVRELLELAGEDKDSIDSFLFHQANAHMVKYVSKRMKLDLKKVPMNIQTFGNISSVSIPLLICDRKKDLFNNKQRHEKVLAAGFGAGFMLAGCIMQLSDLKGGDIIFV